MGEPNIIIEFIDIIGLYGPFILFALSIYFLYPTLSYLSVYLIVCISNSLINNILKNWIREPRPKDPISYYDDNQLTGAQMYGMPSGHAQSVIFSTVFIYLTTNSRTLLLLYVFISALSIFQRWKYRRHTIKQLLAGSIVGAIIALCSIYITKQFLEKYKTSNKIL